MRLLLDTHAVLWWFADDPALPLQTEALIGKLPTGRALCDDFGGYIERFHFTPLPISIEHGRLAGRLPGPTRTPSTACWRRRRWWRAYR